jgi:hypothetical protein
MSYVGKAGADGKSSQSDPDKNPFPTLRAAEIGVQSLPLP